MNAGHLEQRLFSAQSLRIHQFRETVGDIVRNFLLQPGHGDLGMVIYMPLLDHAQSSFFDWRSTIRLAKRVQELAAKVTLVTIGLPRSHTVDTSLGQIDLPGTNYVSRSEAEFSFRP